MIEDQLRSGLGGPLRLDHPDLESALDLVLVRARARRRTRRVAWLASTAVVCVAAALVYGTGGSPRDASPDPAKDLEQPAEVRTLTPQRGKMDAPAAIDPGRYSVRFLDAWAHPFTAVIDVPPGWGQDDNVTLATGPAFRDDVRRLELWTVARVPENACHGRSKAIGPSAADLVSALDAQRGSRMSSVQRVLLDGRPAYRVTLTANLGSSPCPDPLVWMSTLWPKYLPVGETDIIWILDVDGQRRVVDASYGPDVSPAEIVSMLRMAESLTILDEAAGEDPS